MAPDYDTYSELIIKRNNVKQLNISTKLIIQLQNKINIKNITDISIENLKTKALKVALKHKLFLIATISAGYMFGFLKIFLHFLCIVPICLIFGTILPNVPDP
jgi:hypothetical protein